MPDYAEICLRALAAQGLGTTISIGGALGLLHYLDYHSTRDVDAWWTSAATYEERQRIVRVIEESLQPFGQVRKRTWGDVVGIELFQEGKAVFRFSDCLSLCSTGAIGPSALDRCVPLRKCSTYEVYHLRSGTLRKHSRSTRSWACHAPLSTREYTLRGGSYAFRNTDV